MTSKVAPKLGLHTKFELNSSKYVVTTPPPPTWSGSWGLTLFMGLAFILKGQNKLESIAKLNRDKQTHWYPIALEEGFWLESGYWLYL